MPKKLKLSLKDLKVQSFVTAISQEDLRKLKGAADSADISGCAVCVTQIASCLTNCVSCIGTCAVTACDTCTCRPSNCSGWVCC